VEPPDQGAGDPDGTPLLRRGRHRLVQQALGAHPAQRAVADAEPPGVVGDDHRPGQQPTAADGAPQRARGGDPHRVGRDGEPVDAQRRLVRPPGRLVGEDLRRVRRRTLDNRPGQGAAAHVGQRRFADHVLAVAGAQGGEERLARLRRAGAEGGEAAVADLGGDAVPTLACRAAASSTVARRAVASPARDTSRSSAARSSGREVSDRTAWRFEISRPIPASGAVGRSVVTRPWACATGRRRRSPGPKPPTIPAGKGASAVPTAGVSQRSRR
jgi:hypothetical protein